MTFAILSRFLSKYFKENIQQFDRECFSLKTQQSTI